MRRFSSQKATPSPLVRPSSLVVFETAVIFERGDDRVAGFDQLLELRARSAPTSRRCRPCSSEARSPRCTRGRPSPRSGRRTPSPGRRTLGSLPRRPRTRTSRWRAGRSRRFSSDIASGVSPCWLGSSAQGLSVRDLPYGDANWKRVSAEVVAGHVCVRCERPADMPPRASAQLRGRRRIRPTSCPCAAARHRRSSAWRASGPTGSGIARRPRRGSAARALHVAFRIWRAASRCPAPSQG